tara:strand:+ start:7397 stop:7654 length:258 start_codon:yes stop_codon:yes gene_type:complete
MTKSQVLHKIGFTPRKKHKHHSIKDLRWYYIFTQQLLEYRKALAYLYTGLVCLKFYEKSNPKDADSADVIVCRNNYGTGHVFRYI